MSEYSFKKDTGIDSLFSSGHLSKRAYNCCYNANLLTLGSIIEFHNKGWRNFYNIRNCGLQTVTELCVLCNKYKDLVTDEDKSGNTVICEVSDNTAIEELSIQNPKEHGEYAKQFYSLEFERLKGRLSVRGRHLCEETWETYKDMFPFFNFKYFSFCRQFATKKKSSDELFNMLQTFKAIYKANSGNSEDEYSKLVQESRFPFLIDRELDFVLKFKEQYGRYPMLFILNAYFALSIDTTDAIYAYKFGILTGEPHNNDEVAIAYSITGERVRQHIQNYHLNTSLGFATLPDWNYYIEKAPLVITDESDFFRATSQEEQIKNGFIAFAGLLGTVVYYRKLRRKSTNVFVKEKYETRAREILNKLSELLDAKQPRDLKITVSSIVGNNPDENYIATTFLKHFFNINVDEDNTFEIKQRRVDIGLEMTEILETLGYPITLEELFMLFKDRYPEHKYEDATQLRPSIMKSDDIVSIGKSGMYGLKKWNMFTGSVRDCAYMILAQSKDPMPDRLLVERILTYYPNSNYKSIMSSLVSDPKERFAHYTDSTTGLMEYSQMTNKTLTKSRMSSENRLEELKAFLTTYRRWPFISGGDEEASLARWIYNHTRRDILVEYNPEERRQLAKLQEEYANYPQNSKENEFLNLCSDLKVFLEKNYKLPQEESSNKQEAELAVWFKKAITKKVPYQDNRSSYLDELLNYLKDYGFTFK